MVSSTTVLIMALAGPAIEPTLLAWGIQRTGPVTGGLPLNLEAFARESGRLEGSDG